MRNVTRLLVALCGLGAASGCATPLDAVKVVSEAKGSDYFRLGPPGVFKSKDGLRVVGRVCRLSRSTLLSPAAVRIEHLTRQDAVVESARAWTPPIYGSVDQPCSYYAAQVGWKLNEGDKLRACFSRGAACPAEPAAKAVIAAPAQP